MDRALFQYVLSTFSGQKQSSESALKIFAIFTRKHLLKSLLIKIESLQERN